MDRNPAALRVTGPFVGYVAYVDEAGDDGITSVYPLDQNGATQWFALGAAVVPISEDENLKDWVNGAAHLAGIRRRSDIHFRKMNDHKRKIICNNLANKNFRSFIVVTDKTNMRGYRNKLAESVSSKNYFYNFLLRVLLERISEYCANDAKIRYPSLHPRLHVCMSDRGGMNYSETKSYLGRIWVQSKAGKLYLNAKDINWEIFQPSRLESRLHADRAGLQIADVVVSALYKALPHAGRVEGTFVYSDIMAQRLAGAGTQTGAVDVGLKILPWKWRKEFAQKQISYMDRIIKSAGPRLCDPTKCG